MNYLTITELKNYYKDKMDDYNLFFDINEEESLIRSRISEFTRHKGTSYVHFIDSANSNDDIIAEYQLLEMDVSRTNLSDEERIFDICSRDIEARNVSLAHAIDRIIDDKNSFRQISQSIAM